MASPRGWQTVGWFNRGPSPGQFGNAVMAGHVDDSGGNPAVFWRLSELAPGDEISVIGDDGREYVYQVSRTEVYPRLEVPMQQVFGMAPARNLNLTTCEGSWDAGQATYDHRLIVFSTLVDVR